MAIDIDVSGHFGVPCVSVKHIAEEEPESDRLQSSILADLLRKGGVEDPEFLREVVRVLAQGLMELEVAEKIREGSYFPSMLEKVRGDDRVVNMALVVAIGVNEAGDREVLGIDVGLSEDAAFWTEFLRALVARGLKGVRLVISDAHEGLKQAISTVLHGASWQRCRVHFMRNILSHVPKAMQAMVAALVRTIFVQPDLVAARGLSSQRWRRASRSASQGPQSYYGMLKTTSLHTWHSRLSTGGRSTPPILWSA